MAIQEVPALHPVTPGPLGFTPRGDGPLEPETSLREYVAVLQDSRWFLLLGAVIGALAAVLYLVVSPPLYRSDALVQIERTQRGMSTLEVESPLEIQQPTEAEIEIIRSRSLLGSVVDAGSLQISAAPRRFPVIGAALARRHRGPAPAGAWFGMERFGWGGERITVTRVDLPRDWEGVPLRLIALGDGRFAIRDGAGALLAEGEVDKTVSAPLPGDREPPESMRIFVAELKARPGTEFVVAKLPRLAVVAQLQNSLTVKERGNRTGVLQIALSGTEQSTVAGTLDAIASTYLRQNVDRKSEEAQKTLEFLATQLPILKKNVEVAEAALNSYRATRGEVDLTLQATSFLQQSVETERQIQELQFQRAELTQRFTESHPSLQLLNQKIAKLQGDRAGLDARLKRLPDAEIQVARLTRDVQVANNLYTLLLNRSQELKVVKSGTVGNVRILDAAVPAYPVGATSSSTLALGGVLGLLAFAGVVLARRALGTGMEDPDVVERTTGIPLYAAVPRSAVQERFAREYRRGRIASISPLATVEPDGLAMESLRSLRTSLAFSLPDARNHVIAITGPRPGVGKSFIAVNFAHVLAGTGQRVLLVDGDLRNGVLHRYFGASRSPGLAEVIAGSHTVDAVLQECPQAKGLALLSTGTLPPSPAELLAGSAFRHLLETVQRKFDVVVVDTPPILAVTDAAVIARSCGTTLLTLRAGKHPPREVVQALQQLASAGVRPNGIVLNSIDYRRGTSRRYHYQYQYRTRRST